MRLFHQVSIYLFFVCHLKAQLLSPKLTNNEIYSSVVRIEVSTQVYDYKQPWSPGRFGGGIGTGFIVGENQFMTNAHVVSNARRILINKRGSSEKFPARIKYIAHDCDLALLEVEDFSPFAEAPHLKFGEVPKLESEVKAIGYPVGGNRLSVTRGVVSRIDFRPYAHSQIDMHLIVQVDAAINPGNSGGPVIQGNEVVGVAFQGLRAADNTGYMIPTPVVKRFLKDVEDGSYDKYVDLGASHFELFNPAMKKALQLPIQSNGVLISSVTKDGPCDGVLEVGDVLTKIDDYPIDNAGNIRVEGEEVLLHEVVERKFAGDTVSLEFIRNGQTSNANITLVPFPASRIFAIQYDKAPRYVFSGGLLFQPLDVNLYGTYGLSDPKVRYVYTNYVKEGIFKEREDLVILTKVINDKVTSSMNAFEGLLVESINGEQVKSLAHLNDLLSKYSEEEFLEIRFDGTSRPLIYPTEQLSATTERLSKSLGINSLNRLQN